ncbi:dihydrolipoamide acetyltransferase family protein [Planktothrix sp. FACHB-1365]|uniref:dihydrolipoamide acetyltransferase family protein n=1 Tax=Planktothrix sp. FACHB-1365 TaxID=2692855 RepID=UPI0016857707|nr:dihydrolipoamide acetyltransferase family protein [Planktothrix sp. FACHB-1365]MBD2485169.1 2-oxo acid dehydrogenase subunit E2 [Planktothrix sp. FACHB-1365]
MAIHEVFMPALSSTMTEGKIVSWQKSPGDKVEKGETVLIVESDKADMDVESFYEGYLATIIVPAGEAAPVGNTIALIAETQAEIEQAKQKASSQTATTTAPAPVAQAVAASSQATTATVAAAPPTTARNGRIVASPRARKLAKELNIDLARLTGSGPHGRIVAEDVQATSGGSTSTPTVQPSIPAPTVSKPVAPVSTPAPAAVPLGEVAAMNTLQNAVVRNMTASLSVPVFRVGYTITTDALDQLYKQLKSKGVTMTALLAKAVALALQKHPIVNASYVENGIQYHQGINIAIAVAMPDGGLITPVLKNADQVDIYSLSRSWQDLVERSRAKQLQPDEYSSGTFTLSNLGMFGVDRFDAILPQGQGSILAVGASRPQLVVSADGSMAVKRQMQVNITCDHRIIYGADAAAFLQSLAKLIETDVQSLTM